MTFNLDKWLLSCVQDYEKAANSTRFSERWRNEMAQRAGAALGRYYDLNMAGVSKPKFVLRPLRSEALDASARCLARIVRDPKYTGVLKVRV